MYLKSFAFDKKKMMKRLDDENKIKSNHIKEILCLIIIEVKMGQDFFFNLLKRVNT